MAKDRSGVSLSHRFLAGLEPVLDRAPGLSFNFQKILHRSPTDREVAAFSTYLSLLLRWNRVHSLTAYRKPEEIVERLFLDSLLFLEYLPLAAGCRVLDLGSGAGVPGIPLKIVRLEWQLTLIEVRRKRTSFLATVVRELGLEGVTVLTGRAESLLGSVPGLKEGFDAVVTRASGPIGTMAPLALGFVKPGGRFVAAGPPARGSALPGIPGGRWREAMSPVSGKPRLFLVVEKNS
ncbi:MAG: 16S rRNA (guanine(527)-N(7))-methyltransferase RsmG [Candidatus Rokubacteria bacterium]|nr:16S rRNA (guanine(527)-N(7))-methyltransferase RsmG [Candidatus Rokubacteria bacterium]